MNFRTGLLTTTLLLSSMGCVGLEPGVPSWARHVQPRPADLTLGTDRVAREVTDEMARPGIRYGHVAPEEMALVAIQEMRQGRPAEAGLWLSMASYRYHQEARHAASTGQAGVRTLPQNVNPDGYVKLVIEEIRLFSDLDFNGEIDAVSAWARGTDDVEEALQDQLTTLGKTNPIDREALRDLWSELRPNAKPNTEASRYPELAEAFRKRLQEDFDAENKNRRPAYYLARTPIASLQKGAIYAAPGFFEPGMCEGIARAFPLLRPAMIAGLSAKSPEARGNAAATLALAPTDESRAQLEARLAVEPNPRVKLVIAYALVHHGVSEHLVALTAALGSCQTSACTLPAMLVEWLPTAEKAKLDQAPLARIVACTSCEPRGRQFAAIALRDIGRAKPLEPATIEALLTAGQGKNEYDKLPLYAAEAVENAEGLSRAEVLARLQSTATTSPARQIALFPAPLLARLSKVALADDLKLMSRLMERFGEGEGPEASFIVAAALNVPGPEPEPYLTNWFISHKRARTPIAVGLARREGFPRDRFARLMNQADARTRIIVKAITQAPDTEATLINFLEKGNIEERFQAAGLAWTSNQPRVNQDLRRLLMFNDARYYPNDALVRHAAMTSLVRLAILANRPAKTPAGPEAGTPTPPAPSAPPGR